MLKSCPRSEEHTIRVVERGEIYTLECVDCKIQYFSTQEDEKITIYESDRPILSDVYDDNSTFQNDLDEEDSFYLMCSQLANK